MKNFLLLFIIIFLFSNASFLTAQHVGINTTNPQTALHVADDDPATGGLTIGTGTASDGGNLRLLSNSTHWNLDNFQGNLRFFSETGFGTGGIERFLINEDGSTLMNGIGGIERFRINENGNAGFNASSPSVGLNVRNPSASFSDILNVESADGTNRFQVFENGNALFTGPRAGFNELGSGVALNVRNATALASIILNVRGSNGIDRFQVLENGSTVMNGSTSINGTTLMNGRAGIRNIGSTTTFNVRGQFPETLLLNVELSNGVDIFQVQADRDVIVNGNFSVTNGSKNFITDHPLDPANKSLRHSCVESPEVLNVYSGTVILDAQGKAEVELPDYFEALNKDFRYLLTCLGGYAPVFIQKEVENNHFEIAGGTPGLKISWQVTGVRNDPWFRDHPYQAVEEKTGREKGRYYYPEGYGMPAEMSIGKMEEDTEPEMEPVKMEDN